ncbi:hypothetical protein [Streptomyces sp. NEAU-L66]|uniref:hypothetical protein n=1 Tax=Streptomyces sp. NEAU-L66 TaxID=3390812 RepID=UPI0039C60D6F
MGDHHVGYIVEAAEPWFHAEHGTHSKQVHRAPAKELNFYYSEFFHYANNFSIPKAGKYTLRAKLDTPTFLRHGASGEKPALGERATATFRNVELKPES